MKFQTCENCPGFMDDGTCFYTGEKTPFLISKPAMCHRFFNRPKKTENKEEKGEEKCK